MKEHAAYHADAVKWAQSGQSTARLLHGMNAAEATSWMKMADKMGAQPVVTNLQRQYFIKSHAHARSRSRILRAFFIIAAVLIVAASIVAGIMAITAERERRAAVAARDLAEQRRERAEIAEAKAEQSLVEEQEARRKEKEATELAEERAAHLALAADD